MRMQKPSLKSDVVNGSTKSIRLGGAVKKLAEVLDLPRLPERMECFDISHTQGAETGGVYGLSLKVVSQRRRSIVVLN